MSEGRELQLQDAGHHHASLVQLLPLLDLAEVAEVLSLHCEVEDLGSALYPYIAR